MSFAPAFICLLLSLAAVHGDISIAEPFDTDPLANGRFVQLTNNTETRFTYQAGAANLRAILDVDNSTAYYLSQPFANLTPTQAISFSFEFRVVGVDEGILPTAYIGLVTTTHVGRGGDGLTVALTSSNNVPSLTATIDQATNNAGGASIGLASGQDYVVHGSYEPINQSFTVDVYGGVNFSTFIGRSVAIDRSSNHVGFTVDRIGLQNGGGTLLDQSVGSLTVEVDNFLIPGRRPISIEAGSISILEPSTGTTNALLPIRLTSASVETVRVDYATSDLTALAGHDYLPRSGTVEFSPGSTTQYVSVPIMGDSQRELDESFEILLSDPLNAILATSQGLVTIVDGGTLPELRVQGTSTVEGNAGLNPAEFVVSLSGKADFPISVSFVTLAGSAAATFDFQASNGVVAFAPGQTSQVVRIQIAGDNIYETNETFALRLQHPTNAVLNISEAVGVIQNDDPIPSLTAEDVILEEGHSGARTFEFIFRLSNPSSEVIATAFTTLDATAGAGSDYVPTNNTLIFLPNAVEQRIRISVRGDTIEEADEAFILDLGMPSNAILPRTQVFGVILNDDNGQPPPEVSIDNGRLVEGQCGAFQLRLSVTSSLPVIVQYCVPNLPPGVRTPCGSNCCSVTIPPGTLTNSIVLCVDENSVDENDYDLVIVLGLVTNGTVGNDTGVGMVIDNDPPRIQLFPGQVLEGNGEPSSVVFTLILSSSSTQEVQVAYQTADATALAGLDYQATNGTVVFSPGISTQYVSVAVLGDIRYEGNEVFFLQLSNSLNASGFTLNAQGIIQDDDGQPSFSVFDAQVVEGNTGMTNLVFHVALSVAVDFATGVTFVTDDGSANSDAGLGAVDYVPTFLALTFAPGQTNQTVSVPVLGDDVDEMDETLKCILLGSGGIPIARDLAIGTILDDDEPPAVRTISVAPISITEGDTGSVQAVFSAVLSHPSTETARFAFSTEDATALAGLDYLTTNESISFLPGTLSNAFAITVLGDVSLEGDEIVHVHLFSAEHAELATNLTFLTIQDDDETDPTNDLACVSIQDVTVTEMGSGVVAFFTVELSRPSTNMVSLHYATTNGTAANGTDYVDSTGTVVFAPGVTATNIAITVKPNLLDETDEFFFIVLSHPTNALLCDFMAVGTILNPPLSNAVPQITINAVPTNICLIEPAQVIVSVEAQDSDGTIESVILFEGAIQLGQLGMSPYDFTWTNIPPGIHVLTAVAMDDLGARATSAPVVVEIFRAPTLSVGDVAMIEGNGGTNLLQFEITLSHPTCHTVLVDVATANGSAVGGTDFLAFAPTTLVIPPGSTNRSVAVGILGDTQVEIDESFFLVLTNSRQATLARTEAIGTINNDDRLANQLPTASIISPQAENCFIVPTNISIVAAAQDVDGTIVDVAFWVGTMSLGRVQRPPYAFTWTNAPVGTHALRVVAVDDRNGSITSSAVTINVGQLPVLSIADATTTEGNSGTNLLNFALTLSHSSCREVVVDLASADRSAVAGSDYLTFPPMRVEFAPGEVEAIVSVSILGDVILETNETFALLLGNIEGASLARSEATGTILNDDLEPGSTNLTATALTNLVRCRCETAFFGTEVEGCGPFRFTWKHEDIILPGETNRNLFLYSLKTSDAGRYSIEIVGSCGSITNSAVLTIQGEGITNPVTFSNAAQIVMRDNNTALPYPSAINVGCVPGVIKEVSVTLVGFTHSFSGDADILLVSPDGRGIKLLSDVGDNFRSTNLTFTLRDDAPSKLGEFNGLTSGSYLPTDHQFDPIFPLPVRPGPYLTNLAGFTGGVANGAWSLFVLDDATQDTGLISGGWNLTLLWDDAPPALAVKTMAAGVLTLELRSLPGQTHLLEASTDLEHWTAVGAFVPDIAHSNIVVPEEIMPNYRFYRAIRCP